MNMFLNAYLAAHWLVASAKRQLKVLRAKLEDTYPPGSAQLSTDSNGGIVWEGPGREVAVDLLPRSVERAIREIKHPVNRLDAYIKLHGQRWQKKGVDLSTWFRTPSPESWSLAVKAKDPGDPADG